MATDPKGVRRDIERTRGALEDTLGAIGERVAPKKVMSRAQEAVDDEVEDGRALLRPGRAVRRGTERVREALSRSGGTEINERAPDVAGVARRATEELSRAGQRAGDVARAARATPQAAWERAEANPFEAGLVGFAAGFLVASVLPASRAEAQLAERAKERMKPLKDELAGVAKSVGGDVVKQSAQQGAERVKRTAARATREVKAEAQSRAQALKDKAQEAAAEVKDETASAAERVKTEAKRSSKAVKTQAEATTRRVKVQARTAKASGTARDATRRSSTSTPTRRRRKAPPT